MFKYLFGDNFSHLPSSSFRVVIFAATFKAYVHGDKLGWPVNLPWELGVAIEGRDLPGMPTAFGPFDSIGRTGVLHNFPIEVGNGSCA